MRIAMGCDHAGLQLKRELASILRESGHEVEDFGTHDAGSTDFPDFARLVAEAVSAGRFEQGILVCSTGVGMCITANKVKGIRAALCHDTFSARRAREHTDANVLCLGELIVGGGLARDIVEAYLGAEYQGIKPGGERYARRLSKVASLEEENP